MPPTLTLPDIRNTLDGLRRRIEVLERRIRPQATAVTAGGGPFVVVASNDASDDRKALANYVCDGSADQDEIAAALASLNGTGTYGGTVVLLEGSYSLSDRILMGYNTNLVGVGVGVTTLSISAGSGYAVAFPDTPGVLADLTVNDTRAGADAAGVDLGGGAVAVERVGVNGTDGENPGIRMIGQWQSVSGCFVNWAGGVGIVSTSGGIWKRIDRNSVIAATGIILDGSDNSHVVDNVLVGEGAGGATPAEYSSLAGGGIVAAGGVDRAIVHGNWLQAFSLAAIYHGTGTRNIIQGNNVSFTYGDGILIAGGSEANVQGNTIRSASGWGINLTGGSNHFVTNNDAYGEGLNDAATGTVTTAGNRT